MSHHQAGVQWARSVEAGRQHRKPIMCLRIRPAARSCPIRIFSLGNYETSNTWTLHQQFDPHLKLNICTEYRSWKQYTNVMFHNHCRNQDYHISCNRVPLYASESSSEPPLPHRLSLNIRSFSTVSNDQQPHADLAGCSCSFKLTPDKCQSWRSDFPR